MNETIRKTLADHAQIIHQKMEEERAVFIIDNKASINDPDTQASLDKMVEDFLSNRFPLENPLEDSSIFH